MSKENDVDKYILTVNIALLTAIKALLEIQEKYGKVCSAYETCNHKSCESSYSAWACADEALTELEDVVDEITGGVKL